MDFVEIGAQEAAYWIMGQELTKMSLSVVFINTSDNPARFLKSTAELEKMDQDDEDIFQKNMIDRYQERSDKLKDICLAEYVAYYDNIGKKRIQKQKSDFNMFFRFRESTQKVS